MWRLISPTSAENDETSIITEDRFHKTYSDGTRKLSLRYEAGFNTERELVITFYFYPPVRWADGETLTSSELQKLLTDIKEAEFLMGSKVEFDMGAL